MCVCVCVHVCVCVCAPSSLIQDIVKNYEQRGIPLDVLVTDMDWHKTFYKEAAAGKKDQANQTIGWTGFTWDPALFPQPKKFLDW